MCFVACFLLYVSLYVLLYVLLCVFCYMFFVCFLLSKCGASLRPNGDRKKREKMNWWVEKKRSKTGKSGLKKMAKNCENLRKMAKKWQFFS